MKLKLWSESLEEIDTALQATPYWIGDRLDTIKALLTYIDQLRLLLNRCAPQVGSTDDPQYDLACEINEALNNSARRK